MATQEVIDRAVGLDGQLVLLTRTAIEGEDQLKDEGEVIAAEPEVGLMFRKRGIAKAELLAWDDVEDVTRIALKPKELKQKLLKPVDLDDARLHLTDRHGVPLSVANALDPQEAYSQHQAIDHSDLGHDHSKHSTATVANPNASEDSSDSE